MDTTDEIDLKLLFKYPLMSKTEYEDSIMYKGLIEINNEDFEIIVKQTFQNKFLLLKNLDFVDQQVINNIQETASDIVTFLDFIEKHISTKVLSKVPLNNCDIYKQILYEYSEFSNYYLNLKDCYLAYDLSKITATMVDESNREHKIEIRVNYNDKKNIFEIIEYDLPCGRDKFQKSSNLKMVYNQFAQIVETLQLYFNLMEDFDKSCHILDPIPQNRRYNYRRIWLDETVSIIITVDPFCLCALPNIVFLGPERIVEAYRSTMNNNLENWDPTNYIFSEILKLIGLEKFPAKQFDQPRADGLLVDVGECSICFSYRLADNLPEIVCKNEYCSNCYHIACLYEWLMSVNARRFFSEVVGSCPNCEKNISCPIPN
ncbi:E3 ubiquitin-protein ligase FANCL isoform X1 [Diorhabda carinulata]|uniref:E3 ubiquitin-protein ligase FANCL isoform X1 n=1 Tax=Diorhabda carinulata TaxID=1163345 RepID=UPI0025A191C2|nr:E3 ubiquitin-protein ligase FANCL isoform X1 [Diorhabda carinulata]